MRPPGRRHSPSAPFTAPTRVQQLLLGPDHDLEGVYAKLQQQGMEVRWQVCSSREHLAPGSAGALVLELVQPVRLAQVVRRQRAVVVPNLARCAQSGGKGSLSQQRRIVSARDGVRSPAAGAPQPRTPLAGGDRRDGTRAGKGSAQAAGGRTWVKELTFLYNLADKHFPEPAHDGDDVLADRLVAEDVVDQLRTGKVAGRRVNAMVVSASQANRRAIWHGLF